MKLVRPKIRLNDSLLTLATETSELASSKIIRRRNSEINTSIEKKRKTNYETNAAKICYIPSTKVSIGLIQPGENSISLPSSRRNSKEHDYPCVDKEAQNTRRFQRNTERVYENPKNVTINFVDQIDEFNIEECLQQKRLLKRNIEGLKIKCEKCENQKNRLQSELNNLKNNLKEAQIQISKKNAKINELEISFENKQKISSQHLSNLLVKDQQIFKQERFIEHLKSQINNLPNTKRLATPNHEKNTVEIIAKLSNQIKYKEIEVHMLKKEKYDFSALQQQIKTLTAENKQLKSRVSNFVRMKRRMYMQESSQSSVSLNLSEVSPDKKKSSYRR